MLRHHLLVALRTARRHIGYTLLNLVGLAVGLACCLLILLFVLDERSYDRAVPDGDRIYRLVSHLKHSAASDFYPFSTVGWPFGRILETEYPEVEDAVYLRSQPSLSIVHNDERLYETLLWAEDGFFDLFPFQFIEGTPARALERPNAVVLSKTLARKLYGDASALGRTLVLADTLAFEVTGVAAVPEASHIQFDALASFPTLRAFYGSSWDFSGRALDVNMLTYVRLREGAGAEALHRAIRTLPMDRFGEGLASFGTTYHLGLQPLRDIYLSATFGNPLGPHGSRDRLYLLGSIALLVLLVAGINFVNLTTARSMERGKEVGVRKASGSTRRQLVRQFLTESTALAGVAFLLALGLISLALPLFNPLIGKAYAMADVVSGPLVLGAGGLILGMGVLAGLYPAFVLASFRPAQVLKGRFATSARGAWLRQGLVIVQFAASCVLLVATFVVLRQLDYMQAQDLGFAGDQILVLDARRAPSAARADAFAALRSQLEQHSGVQISSVATAVPGQSGWRSILAFPEGWADDESLIVEYIATGFGYTETVGLSLAAGRDLNEAFATDADRGLLLNEVAVQAMGWSSPQEALGKAVTMPGADKEPGVIVGVVRDYHHHGLQETIQPIVYGIMPDAAGYVALRVAPDQAGAVLDHAHSAWEAQFPGYPMATFFADDAFARQYQDEERLAQTFGVFAGLATLIGCLGLFGLAAFTARRRTKEIGVRKVLGASAASIVGLLSWEFLRLVFIAFAFAVPIAALLMRRWLADFAYAVDLGAGVFALVGLLAVAIAFLTVSYQALRTALANPIDSLRYE